MKRSRPLVLIILLLLSAVVALSACSPGGTGTDITVRVVVTQNFGRDLMLEETIRIPSGTSALEALQQVADVETAYGGGFVNAINEVRSQYPAQEDWFFYVNGISTNKGAADYILEDGDIQHWDFHDWSFRIFIPAMIGDFPQPFLHGYEGQVHPTVIVYADGLREEAEALERGLAELGVEDVSVKHTGELTDGDKQRSNLIILGTRDSDPVSEINTAWDSLGFFVQFEGDTMIVHDSKGEVEAEYGAGCGVVQATQSPWNPKGIGACENVVWTVSGTDEAGVKSAVDALINRHDQFQYAFAVVITNGEIIRVPQ